ncbi:MBL fold metallo-hydrolase [Nakamurella silvestris]|nr:MBL fold metallo-hydrolase [Nakamurella silvestris]
MFISGFPAGSFQANCFLIAPEGGGPAVIVDPGEDATERIVEIVKQNGLAPVAVLLTHGHLDHTASLLEVCRTFDIPVLIHPDDEYMLDDPLAALSSQLKEALADRPTGSLRPEQVLHLVDGGAPAVADLPITVDHTPGHTGGSVVFRIAGDGDRPEVLFTGDTLFAGSVGRTDLPGGSREVLDRSLAGKLLVRPDAALVLPGHGPTSSIGDERRTNPFLQGLN